MYNRPHTGRSARGNPPLQRNRKNRNIRALGIKLWHQEEHDIQQPFVPGGADYHKFDCTSEQFTFAYFSVSGTICQKLRRKVQTHGDVHSLFPVER
jgi:hypothetical protein